MRIFFLTLSISFFSVSFSYAESVTISQFLDTAENDYRLKNHDELVAYFRDAPVSTPYLDKVELRAETEEFNPEKQKYSVRFYPKAWGETECSNRVSETVKKVVRAEHEALFSKAVADRYELALDFLETLSSLNMRKELLLVYDDQITVLRKMSAGDFSFDVSTVVAAEDRYVSLQLEVVELENKITAIIEAIKSISGYHKEIRFDEEGLISPETVGERIRDFQPVSQPDNIRLTHQKLETELAENKYLLETAKSKKYLSFFKVEYDIEKHDELEEAFSFEVGFNLPFVSSDREDIHRRKRNYLEEKLKYEAETRKAYEKISALSNSLNRLIRQHQILSDRKTSSNAEISFKKYMGMKGVNPLTLLKIRESILKSDVQLNRITYLIRRHYIDLMNITGKLAERPLKNYLLVNSE
jgi:hypothetical protein